MSHFRRGTIIVAALIALTEPAAGQVFEVPQLADSFDVEQEGVAKGAIEEIVFQSNVLGEERAMLVYLPPQYQNDDEAHFPLLVLRHGGGWEEDGWIADGEAGTILDNLIHNGAAEPMIVAMPASWMPGELGNTFLPEATRAAADELFEDILPLLHSRYRIAAGPENLALAGLSAGGGQTWFIGTANPDRFSALGVFSTGAFGGIDIERMRAMMENPPPSLVPPPGRSFPPMPEPFDAERDLGPALRNAQRLNANLNLFYISVGDEDDRYEATAQAVDTLRDGGLEIVATQQSGGHTWAVWRQALADFAPRLFRK